VSGALRSGQIDGKGKDGKGLKLTVGVSIVGYEPVVPQTIPHDAPQAHVDDPYGEGDQGGERCAERHEDGADSRIASTAKSEYTGYECECGCYWMEDEDAGEGAEGVCPDIRIADRKRRRSELAFEGDGSRVRHEGGFCGVAPGDRRRRRSRDKGGQPHLISLPTASWIL